MKNIITKIKKYFLKPEESHFENYAIRDYYYPPPIDQMRENRFVVEFPKELKLQSYWFQKCSLPKLVNLDWEKIEFSFIDIIAEECASKALYDYSIYLKKHFKHPLSRIVLFEKENNKFCNEFEFKIKLSNLEGVVSKQWIITSHEFPEFDFGCCDYSSINFKMVKLIINPCNCVLI